MMFDIFLNNTYIQSKHERDVFGPLIKVHSPKLKVSRLDKGSRANQLRQVENSHIAVQGGVGGRFWAVRCGATRLSWVWPEICWLWLEQSIPYHGAWCSGMFLKTFGMFLLPVQVSLTRHISLFQRSTILLCYQMPSWSTCPTRPALTSQSFAPVRVTATAWRLWRTSSTKTFLESTVLLLSSTSQHRGTSENRFSVF